MSGDKREAVRRLINLAVRGEVERLPPDPASRSETRAFLWPTAASWTNPMGHTRVPTAHLVAEGEPDA